MNNIFNHVERNVEPAKTITKEYRVIDKISEAAATAEALRKIHEQDKQNQIIESVNKYEETCRKQNKMEKVILNSIHQSKFTPVINNIYSNAKTNIFKDILFEVFYNALVLDESFIASQKNSLKYVIDQYVDENGGFDILENAIEKSNSVLLKRIKNICIEVADRVCKRKIKECNDQTNPNDINFDINEEEKEYLDYSKSDINLDKISDLVKQKVLTVVKDEKERQESNDETMAKIEDEVKSRVNEASVSAIESAYNSVILSKSVIEEGTLFNSLLRSTYRDFLLENVAITSTDKDIIEKQHERSRVYDVDLEEDDIKEDENIENEELNDNLVLENTTTVDMDTILTESIAKYTIMETLYTLKLENYTYESMHSLTEKLLNPVTESSKPNNNNKFIETRKEFFKYFNKILNLTSIDKSKEAIEKLKDSDGFDTCVKMAKKELNNTKEKNPQLKDKYADITDWLNNL